VVPGGGVLVGIVVVEFAGVFGQHFACFAVQPGLDQEARRFGNETVERDDDGTGGQAQEP